ncbi:hypothetical protein Sulku_1446 [Sulfuricurvum kujiense DSM 16994]|uniref:Uncharacterized protein n=1 Tax=Sulfuricurvum kujiense (strain ATCC BAA-921 / DSM 16994 / JCM 11577 / YK-1) TaxID=709032 RepID=E4TZ93_SULKY|nr:hypothetical protein [Sulfuricurvum kujiense]ADR34108.1 hypothetical protein Sulku_1446 [Sulfuricurvum kujiense DSM 16994]
MNEQMLLELQHHIAQVVGDHTAKMAMALNNYVLDTAASTAIYAIEKSTGNKLSDDEKDKILSSIMTAMDGKLEGYIKMAYEAE